jgi:hypothetical protein
VNAGGEDAHQIGPIDSFERSPEGIVDGSTAEHAVGNQSMDFLSAAAG